MPRGRVGGKVPAVHHAPLDAPLVSLAPFVVLLLCIACLPLFAPLFWARERNQALVTGVLAAPVAAWLLAAGSKGVRRALPNSRIMIHQPLGGFRGQATDIEIHAQEILFLRRRMNEILAAHTGQPVDKIKQDTERDRFLSAQDAQEYGIIDAVIASPKSATDRKKAQG